MFSKKHSEELTPLMLSKVALAYSYVAFYCYLDVRGEGEKLLVMQVLSTTVT